MRDLFTAVAKFHRDVLDLPIPPQPAQLSAQRKAWAITAMQEELDEFRQTGNIVDEADALGDLLYFTYGRFHEMNIDPAPVLAEIQRANLSKVRGSLSKRPDSLGYDAAKPEGWKAPEHVLRAATVPKLAIIGHAGHGKDTVAELLEQHHGYLYESTSFFVAETIIYPALTDRYCSPLTCFLDKQNCRDEWYELITSFLAGDRGRLAREMLKVCDLYIGCRSPLEFAAVRKEVDHVVWVEARDRLPLEPATSMGLEAHMADTIIDNNGSPEDLRKNVDRFIAREF